MDWLINSVIDGREAGLFHCCLQIVANSLALVSFEEIVIMPTVETTSVIQVTGSQPEDRDPWVGRMMDLSGHELTDSLEKQKMINLIHRNGFFLNILSTFKGQFYNFWLRYGLWWGVANKVGSRVTGME